MSLECKKILVTGGTGFIGGRLVEKLILEHGARVRLLVHSRPRAARVARFDLEMLSGTVTDRQAVFRAVEGCDLVFHCAFGSSGSPQEQWAVTVDGTQALVDAMLAARVPRLVHVSTHAVYGRPSDGRLDETAPRQPTGWLYGDSKLQAEELLLDAHQKHGLPVSIIQPSIVYGPFGGGWTTGQLQQLSHGRIPLIDGGHGLCNAVYVDDVVEAMLLAAGRDQAVGQLFLISGAKPVTWCQFYAAYEKMIGSVCTVTMSAEEARLRYRYSQPARSLSQWAFKVLRERADVRERLTSSRAVGIPVRIARRVLPGRLWNGLQTRFVGHDGEAHVAGAGQPNKPIILLSDDRIKRFQAKVEDSIDKAVRLLGYQPRFDLVRGMALTEQWARWANLIPGR